MRRCEALAHVTRGSNMTVTIPYNAVQAVGLKTATRNDRKKCSGRGIEVPYANQSHVRSTTCMSDRTRQATKMKMLHARSHGMQGRGRPLSLVLGPEQNGGQVKPCRTNTEVRPGTGRGDRPVAPMDRGAGRPPTPGCSPPITSCRSPQGSRRGWRKGSRKQGV